MPLRLFSVLINTTHNYLHKIVQKNISSLSSQKNSCSIFINHFLPSQNIQLMASSSPESILKEAMQIEQGMVAAEAELSKSKQAVLDHLMKFSDMLSLGVAVIDVADAAEKLMKLMMSPEINDGHANGLARFDGLAFPLALQLRELSQSCHNIDSDHVSVLDNFKKSRCQYLRLTAEFEVLLAELKKHFGFVPADADGKSFMEKYFMKIYTPTEMYFVLD